MHRRLVLKLTFAENLSYCRKSGFRTPELALPFKALASFREGERVMAGDRKPDASILFRFVRNPSQLCEILSSGGGEKTGCGYSARVRAHHTAA
jgi:hypothetical protein